ncbi:MAG: DUF2791 family P-loop domain-containing protein, partial [Caldilineaceae bacterium]|nr:DUF2791 family P-loop domain-containing protein [Caldilineaceae bacterium]
LFRQAAAAYQDDLLPGCYEEWLLTERARLKQLQLHLLHHLTVLLAEAGDDAVAIHYAGELCRCDPLREQSYRLLMSCHAACGDRAAALRTYHDCVAVLDSELGVEPEPETQALYQRLLNHGTIAAVAAPLTTRSVALDHILVGRTAEWQQLLASWQQAGAGASRLVLIQGDAGIGKTHLAEALLTWARQRGQLTVHTRAYAAEGQLSYSPVVEWLRSPPYANLATELADVWLTECSRLLPELLTTRPQLAASPPLNDSGQRRRLFEALARAALLPRQPLLVLIDDLQWADQETVEWLHFLLRFDPTAPRLVVGTVRQSEISANHPLANLQQELHRVGWIQEIILTPLTPEASAELAQKTAGSALSKATLANLHHYAEGVPLFLVEAVRAEIEKAEAERWRWSATTPLTAPNALPLPPKVYAVIQSRLNQLSPGARQVANVAAVIGRAFAPGLLVLVTQSDEQTVLQSLEELWQRRIVQEQGTNYDLSHDRIRDVVYAELSPIQRKVLHRRIAEALLRLHEANPQVISAQLAYHCEAAGLFAAAVDYYLQAGQAAQQLYANHQACELLQRGIALFAQLPATAQRDAQALELYTHLAMSQQTLMGWTSTAMYETVSQAWVLSLRLQDQKHRFRLLKFMFSYRGVRGEWAEADNLTQQMAAIAEAEPSAPFHVIAFNALASIDYVHGDFAAAQRHFNASVANYAPQDYRVHSALAGSDYGILSQVWRSHNLWLLGYPDQALVACREGLAWAETTEQPFGEGQALAYLAMLYLCRQEWDEAARCAERCLAVVTRYEIGYYQQMAQIIQVWVRAMRQADPAEVHTLQQALAEFEAIGAKMRWSYYLSLVARLYEQTGQITAGLAIIAEAFAAAAQSQEAWWNAELYRLRGNLLLRQSSHRDSALAEQSHQ